MSALAGMLADKPGTWCISTPAAASTALDPGAESRSRNGMSPISHFWPTHVTRSEELFAQAQGFGQSSGGRIDITSYAELYPEGKIRPSKAIMECLRSKVPCENITVSSDGNGSVPKYDAKGNIVGIGVGSPEHFAAGFFKTWSRRKVSASARLFPSLPPTRLKSCCSIPPKAALQPGSDADILIMSENLELRSVFAGGRQMMDKGIVTVKGLFEA